MKREMMELLSQWKTAKVMRLKKITFSVITSSLVTSWVEATTVLRSFMQ
jgi:hypothetical protein